jgi:hypothetical protein
MNSVKLRHPTNRQREAEVIARLRELLARAEQEESSGHIDLQIPLDRGVAQQAIGSLNARFGARTVK